MINTLAQFMAQIGGTKPPSPAAQIFPPIEAGDPNTAAFFTQLAKFSGQQGNQNAETIGSFTLSGSLPLHEDLFEKLASELSISKPLSKPQQPSLEALQNTLQDLRYQLQNAEGNSDTNANIYGLAISGLNTSDMTVIQGNIQALEDKLGRPVTIEDLIAGVGGVLQDTDQIDIPEELSFVRLQPVSDKSSENIFDVTNAEDTLNGVYMALPAEVEPNLRFAQGLASALNAISVGDQTALLNRGAQSQVGAFNQSMQPELGKFYQPQNGIQPGNGKNSPTLNTPNAQTQNIGDAVQPKSFDAMILAPLKPLPITPENFPTLSFDPTVDLGIDIESGLPFTNTTQAAHNITQSTQSAGQAHPASQMVAAKLQQNIQTGETKNITLYLEPADLGKVEVRMDFSATDKMKAVMVVEKPETYMMLQRDAYVLERALQDTGLDMSESSLEFELAEDGQAFGQNNDGADEQNGKSGAHQNGAADGDALEELEITTMTWDVDPNTGHVHYNIMA